MPRKVLESTYGKGVFFEEAFNDSFPKYYGEVLDKETDLYPVDKPDVDVKDINEKGIVFTALITTKPVVVVENYKGFQIDKIEYPVTDADIDGEVEKAKERASRLVPVEGRAAILGDTAILDYSGSVDGVKFEGGTAENQTLELGSKSFIPGFEEQVCGMAIGEEKDIEVTFPENYKEPLNGKKAVFHIKLNELKAKEIPEFNDEFVKDVSEFNTVEEYKADIKKRLTEENSKRAAADFENIMIDKINEATPFSVPKVMIESQIDSMVKEMEYRLMYQGAKMEDFLKYTNQTAEGLRKTYEAQAEKSVRTRLIFEALIKQEDIKAEEGEIDAKLAEIAESSKKPLEEYKKTVSERQMDYITNEIMVDKLFKRLKELNPSK